MKKTIKKSFIGAVVFLFTVIIGTIAYAAVSSSITSGTSLTASMWNEMAGNYEYSTTEVNTGKKWIDGKPIYRKVISVTLPSNNNWESKVNLSSMNIETPISLDYSINNTVLKSRANIDSNDYELKFAASSLTGRIGTSYGGGVLVAIIEYTKQ